MSFWLWKRRLCATCLALSAACGFLWPPAQTLAQCATTGTNQTCTNPTGATVSGGFFGIEDTATLTVTNFGTVSGTGAGSFGIVTISTANVTNSGTISAGAYGIDTGTANVANSGNISGGVVGIDASTANVTNSGTISGTSAGSFGVFATSTANVTNSGTISGTGADSFGIVAIGTANVTNSGTISGGAYGINTGTANVANSGNISGGVVGINATTANVTNSGDLSGGVVGVDATTANVTNSGTISGTGAGSFGIFATSTANVTNSGTISGTGANSFGIVAIGTADVTNFGIISGGAYGINTGTANVANSGNISGGVVGINATTANVTNSGNISGGVVGIDASTANVTNSGTISGTGAGSFGIFATSTANVTNSGTISGTGADSFGIVAISTVNVTNSGTISGGAYGIDTGTANIANSGNISGGVVGIDATTATVTNSGTISGATGIFASAPSILVNSGAVVGTGGTAINFSLSNSDNLTFLPGSRIQGLIDLGAGDTVTFGSGNWLYTFGGPNAPSTATISTGGAPFVVAGNRVAVLDPTPFGLADKNLMDFTGAISGILGSIGPTTPGTRGSAPLAFAPRDSGIEAQVDDAFASIPALAYANDGVLFKNPTAVTDDGRSVWARGFVGERVQQADGVILHATNDYAGGAVGADLLAGPDLRLGVFAGGGSSKLTVDDNLENTNTNTLFGGLYGRYAFTSLAAPSFLDFALHGGASTNANTRIINNNLVPSGTEIASANYNSSYVSPELKYGVNLSVWPNYTLTPSIGVRYVAGFFCGYTESGSTADLTVAGRTTQDTEERGELQLTHTTSFMGADQLLTSIYGGVLGLERAGDTTVNTVQLGADLPFVTPGQNDVAGALGGLAFEWRTRAGVSFFGAGEYTAISDKSSNIAAKGGVRVAF
jgi:hypothetical protein